MTNNVSIEDRELKKIVDFVTGYTKKYKEYLQSAQLPNNQIFFERRWTFLLCLEDYVYVNFKKKFDDVLSVCLKRVLNETGDFLDGYRFNKNFLDWHSIELRDEVGMKIHNMILKMIDLINIL